MSFLCARRAAHSRLKLFERSRQRLQTVCFLRRVCACLHRVACRRAALLGRLWSGVSQSTLSVRSPKIHNIFYVDVELISAFAYIEGRRLITRKIVDPRACLLSYFPHPFSSPLFLQAQGAVRQQKGMSRGKQKKATSQREVPSSEGLLKHDMGLW